MKLTPVLNVERVEPCVEFWQQRMGFNLGPTVPHGDVLGFAMLEKDGVELMYQHREAAGEYAPPAGATPTTQLFIEVADLDAVEKAMQGVIEIARHTTFYGMDEIGVYEPGGTLVIFAQPSAGQGLGGE